MQNRNGGRAAIAFNFRYRRAMSPSMRTSQKAQHAYPPSSSRTDPHAPS